MDKIKIPNEMDIMKMSLFLKVMADSTRVKILFSIKDEPKSVNEIVEIVGATQSAVSHQSQSNNRTAVSRNRMGEV